MCAARGAGAIVAVMLDRGQAVMKAAGADAITVAIGAVIGARRRLLSRHNTDVMLTASWTTEDTLVRGREDASAACRCACSSSRSW